jgi:hypothetical protein
VVPAEIKGKGSTHPPGCSITRWEHSGLMVAACLAFEQREIQE